MITLKRCLYVLIPIVMGVAIVSCKNSSSDDGQLPVTPFKQPVTVPLNFGKPKKLILDTIKSTRVTPVTTKFDIDKLPLQTYSGDGLKPFTHKMEESRFDYSAFPEKDLDLDKLPSKPLKFKTFKLPPPQPVKSAPPHLKDTVLSVYEFGEAQGLQGEAITCLFNDREGFLWIGTVKGLYRYDGENLLFYIPTPYSDFYHNISGILEDTSGHLWIAVGNEGIEVFDPVNGTLKKTNVGLGLGSNNPYGLLEDKQQRIWISALVNPGGVMILDTKTLTVKWLDTSQGIADTQMSGSIMQDEHGNIWVGGWKGINVIDPEHKKIKTLNRAYGLRSDSVEKIISDAKGNIYLAMHSGLLAILNLKKGTQQVVKEAQSPHAFTYALMLDDKQRILQATDNSGVEIIDLEKRTARNLKTSDGLAGNYVNYVTQDSRGQVWIATQTGLNLIDNKKAVIERIGTTPTTTLAEDGQGLIWQGTTYKGINILNRETKTLRSLNASSGLANDTMNFIKEIKGRTFISTNKGLDIIDPLQKTKTHLGKQQGLDDGLIIALAVDSAGRIWIGGGTHLGLFDPRSNTLKQLGKAQGLSDNNISDMSLDKQNRLWINTQNEGVEEIDLGSMIIRHIDNAPLTGIFQRVLLTDDSGNLWVGASAGINIIDAKNNTVTLFSAQQGLIDNFIVSLQKHNNQVFAGTTKGISVITPPNGSINSDKKWGVASFGKYYGLNKLQVAFETDMVTKDGLYWWADNGVTVLDVSKKDHYQSPVYITGMSIADQSQFFIGQSPAISKGISWDKVSGPNNMPSNLQLRYDQNYLRFSYGLLNSAIRDTTWYRYKLIGADKNWSGETFASSSKNYFGISPGEYTFEVISKNADNKWSTPTTLSFTINPPWWQTWWAYTLYVCLFAASLWGFSHYRSTQLIKAKRILEYKVHIRTEEVISQKEEIEAQRDNLEKAFTELKSTQAQLIQSEKMASLGELTAGIAHEIQNPLNFVNNFSEVSVELLEELTEEARAGHNEDVIAIAGDLTQNLEKIKHHGKRADFIVKGMLQHSRSNTGEKQLTDMNVLCDEFLKLSFHGMRAKDKSFNAEMIAHFDPKLPKVNVSQQDMGRVMLNLFNNAFYAVNQKAKTAGVDYKPTVEVTTFTIPSPGESSRPGGLGVSVKDNGVGISDAIKDKIMQPFFTTKPTGEGTGLGLSLTYDMVVKGHGGSIEVNTKEGGFTQFNITLPIK